MVFNEESVKMKRLRQVIVLVPLWVCLSGGTAWAQAVSAFEGLTLSEALAALTGIGASTSTGQALSLATALEVATTPLGSSSAGFVFKLDPATGLQVRTATTFGPALAERALTSGAGKLSVSANLTISTFDRLGPFKLNQMELGRIESANPNVAQSGFTSLVLSSQTMLLVTSIGATEKLDLSVAVPLVKVKLDGLSWVETQAGDVLERREAAGVASGLGDIALLAKFRLLRFGEGEPDPGGVAVLGTMRLPTGDRENLRGLGITRTMASLVASTGRGRFRPHGSAGFEFWSDGIEVFADPREQTEVTVRNQLAYNIGVEYEAAPKVTVIADILGRHILGGGRVQMQPFDLTGLPSSVTGFSALAATEAGVRKITLAPGLKWNVKGQVLLSLNALIPLFDNGLHDLFTPVIGIDMTF
jgi:hypothetical protein